MFGLLKRITFKNMFMIILNVMIQLRTITGSHADNAASKQLNIRETITEFIHGLCPLVDICNVNATNAEVKPNEIISRGLVSCCQGCSCHPDCKENDNCCYPDDYKSNSEAQPAIKLTECLYTRRGQPEMIDGLVPAYKTIVGEPKGGCVDTKPIRISPKVVLHPTCDDIDVTPLGPYFPVFSRDTGAIYKNVLCARCHGINNIDSFSANLTCRHTKQQTQQKNSMTEFLNFLDTGSFSTECHVDFIFNDLTALKENRCYRDAIDTCTSQYLSFPNSFNPAGMNLDIIQSLCESGLNLPTVNIKNSVVYKNEFCSLCGTTKRGVNLLCYETADRTSLDKSLTILLNTKIMHAIDKSPDLNTKNELCLMRKGTGQHSKEPKICKTIYCPTGKIRNGDGDCELIGNYLAKSKGIVNIKLTPTENIDLGNESQETFSEQLVQGLKEKNPWPVQWRVIVILYRINLTECDKDPFAVIWLAWENRNTKDIYDEIKNSIRSPWLFEWKGKTYNLTQSLSKYRILWIPGSPPVYRPSWQRILTAHTPKGNYIQCEAMRWVRLFRDPIAIREDLFFKKLFFCDQIQLRPDEFILGPDRSYLESNLTERVLYDLEFDVVEDKDGLTARVCLNDTILIDKDVSEGTTLETTVIGIVLICKIAFTVVEYT